LIIKEKQLSLKLIKLYISAMQKQNYIITSGDANSIGYEITVKALCGLKLPNNCNFYILRHSHASEKYTKMLQDNYHVYRFNNLQEALNFQDLPLNSVIEVLNTDSAAEWFSSSVNLAKDPSNNINSIITGPISKASTACLSHSPLGHTEILQNNFQEEKLKMCFLGNKFNLILHTHHIPISQIRNHLNPEELDHTIITALKYRSLLTGSNKTKPIGFIGLNPHAGEGGLLGEEETKIIIPTLAKYSGEDVQGPLVPDVAFQEKYWQNYSFYISLYHDQGLIPFKLIHGQNSGIQVTLGLPFIRTSVDHGTATDIFDTDCANPESMKLAISKAVELNFT